MENSTCIEQVQSFMFLGYKLAHLTEEDTDWKITQFNYVCVKIRRAMKGKARSQLI